MSRYGHARSMFFVGIIFGENFFHLIIIMVIFFKLVNAGEDVLIFYNDKSSFNQFIEMMRTEKNNSEENSPLKYVHFFNYLPDMNK